MKPRRLFLPLSPARWAGGALLWWILIVSIVRAAEPSAAPVLRIEAGMHAAAIKRISTDAAGRLALTASEDKTARLWELPSGRLLRVLRPPIGEGNEGKLYCGALSPDGSLAAVGGWTSSDAVNATDSAVYLFDTATGRVVRRLGGLPNVINDVAFSAQGRWLAAVLHGGHGLRVWETGTGAEVGRDADYGQRQSDGLDWHGEKRLVTTCFDGMVRLYELNAPPKSAARGKLALLTKGAARAGKMPQGVRFSPDGRRIAVGFQDTPKVVVHDGNDLSFLFAPDTTGIDNGNLVTVAWSHDGAILAAAGAWFRQTGLPVRFWPEGGKGAPHDEPAAWNTIGDLRALPGGGFLGATHEPAWGLLIPKASRRLGEPPIADWRNDIFLANFRLSGDGTTVGFDYDLFGKTPAKFSVAGRQLVSLKGNAAASDLRATRFDGLPITDWRNHPTPKLAGKPLALERLGMSRSLAIAGNSSFFLHGTEWQLRSFTSKGKERWKVPSPGPVWALNLADSDRLGVAAYADGSIRWHRADNGRELLAFFPHADRERWVLWTPEGYYDCSPGGEELIGWHVNRSRQEAADFFPASKFRDRFYRPDVISRVLESRDVTAALKAANADAGRRPTTESVRTEDVVVRMAPPVVELAVGSAGAELSVPADAASVKVRYRVRRTGEEPINRVRVLVDGRPVKLEAPVPANNTDEAETEVPLPAGRDGVVSLLAEHRFAVSEPATLRVVRSGAPPAPTPDVLKPKLYLLAAGITDYLHNDQLDDLHFAAKDAADFAAAFRRQEGGLYQKIEAKVLGDKEATAANILDGLDWIKQQTTAKDVAVIFLSGHGENDEELRYYFCPHDYDKARRLRTGVSFEEIQKTVRSIPGKMLFFIDSCHAGNALGKLFAAKSASSGVDVTRLVNELSGAENGAIVFTSSTGRQLSLELAREGNGAFTKAIVEGLDGRADLLKNGKITVSTLEAFVAERVKELTEGAQTPTVAKPQTVPDFPIGIRK